MAEEKFFSVTEFAEKYGMDVGNVRRYILQGRLEAFKVGKQWIIPAHIKPPTDNRVRSGKYIKANKSVATPTKETNKNLEYAK